MYTNKIAIRVYTPRTVALRAWYLFFSKCQSITDEIDDPVTSMYNEIYSVITSISTPQMEQHVPPEVRCQRTNPHGTHLYSICRDSLNTWTLSRVQVLPSVYCIHFDS